MVVELACVVEYQVANPTCSIASMHVVLGNRCFRS